MFEQTRHELLRELDMDVLDQQSTTQLQEEYKQLSKENVRISCSDFFFYQNMLLLKGTRPWERSGSVVECLSRDGGAEGSSLTSITALWSLSKIHLSWFSTGSTQEDPSLFN